MGLGLSLVRVVASALTQPWLDSLAGCVVGLSLSLRKLDPQVSVLAGASNSISSWVLKLVPLKRFGLE